MSERRTGEGQICLGVREKPDELKHAVDLLTSLCLHRFVAILAMASIIGTVLTHALNRWEALTRYCNDGQLEFQRIGDYPINQVDELLL